MIGLLGLVPLAAASNVGPTPVMVVLDGAANRQGGVGGTFTATAPLFTAGTFHDGTALPRGTHIHVKRVLSWPAGGGELVTVDDGIAEAYDVARTWRVLSGTGALRTLRGEGTTKNVVTSYDNSNGHRHVHRDVGRRSGLRRRITLSQAHPPLSLSAQRACSVVQDSAGLHRPRQRRGQCRLLLAHDDGRQPASSDAHRPCVEQGLAHLQNPTPGAGAAGGPRLDAGGPAGEHAQPQLAREASALRTELRASPSRNATSSLSSASQGGGAASSVSASVMSRRRR